MRRRSAAPVPVLLAAALLMGGCGIAPVTTLERADGTQVTLRWADYPGHAYVDAEHVLATRAIGELQAHASALMADVRARVADEVGIRLAIVGREGRWFDTPSNGYGGESLLTSYTCCTLRAEEVPSAYADWERVLAVVAEVAEEYGAGPMVREQDQEDDPEQRAQFERDWATGIPGEYALLDAWTSESAQEVLLLIDDPSRRAGASAEERANEPRLEVTYSVTTVRPSDWAEFERRVAPYAGAEKPDSSEWD